MNKSPLYLRLLKWFLLGIGRLSAFINTSLTSSAVAADHSIGGLTVGIGLALALVLTAVEAVFGHILSSFASIEDLTQDLRSQWSRELLGRLWLVFAVPVALIALAQVYSIDTSTTYLALVSEGIPDEWAITFSVILVFSFEVCLIASRWVGRQYKRALREYLEKTQSVDADIEYHRSRRSARLRTARDLGARNGYNEASERYAKTIEGR